MIKTYDEIGTPLRKVGQLCITKNCNNECLPLQEKYDSYE